MISADSAPGGARRKRFQHEGVGGGSLRQLLNLRDRYANDEVGWNDPPSRVETHAFELLVERLGECPQSGEPGIRILLAFQVVLRGQETRNIRVRAMIELVDHVRPAQALPVGNRALPHQLIMENVVVEGRSGRKAGAVDGVELPLVAGENLAIPRNPFDRALVELPSCRVQRSAVEAKGCNQLGVSVKRGASISVEQRSELGIGIRLGGDRTRGSHTCAGGEQQDAPTIQRTEHHGSWLSPRAGLDPAGASSVAGGPFSSRLRDAWKGGKGIGEFRG